MNENQKAERLATKAGGFEKKAEGLPIIGRGFEKEAEDLATKAGESGKQMQNVQQLQQVE